MKRIYFIRHAKSSWDNLGLTDHQRPLAQRGIKAAKTMASAIWERNCPLDRLKTVYSSSALRAQQTIALISEQLLSLGMIEQPISVNIDDRLYSFDSYQVLTWLREQDKFFAKQEGVSSAHIEERVIVGHNPAFELSIEYLTGQALEKLPTCAYVQLETDLASWCELQANTCRLTNLITPKMC